MASLEIDSLTGSNIYVPCVDRLGDGKTPFLFSISSFVGGADGQALPAYVPAYVGSLESVTITPAHILPTDLAYQNLANGYFSSLTKAMILPNPISGPGAFPAAIDLLFTTTTRPTIPASTFHYLINQPIITNLTLGLTCFRQPYYFNETFAAPVMRTGTVTLYEIAGVQPAAVAGRYLNVAGMSANAVSVGYNPQTCAQSAAQNDASAQH